jgi:hypothetical protein
VSAEKPSPKVITDPLAHMHKLYPDEPITADINVGTTRIIFTDSHYVIFLSEKEKGTTRNG